MEQTCLNRNYFSFTVFLLYLPVACNGLLPSLNKNPPKKKGNPLPPTVLKIISPFIPEAFNLTPLAGSKKHEDVKLIYKRLT